MDRLSSVKAWSVVMWVVLSVPAVGCDDAPAPPPSGSRRVVAVAAEKPTADLDAFCDAHPPAASAPTFAFPALAGEPPPASGAWRWVNVWATWCEPCVEEIPFLKETAGAMKSEGKAIDLVLLSADGTAEAVDGFRAAHAGTPEGPRVADPEGVPPWLVTMGLDEGAPLPIHLFVDPAGKVRCARSGAVEDDDLPSVQAVLGS